jgi:hypothetical protein
LDENEVAQLKQTLNDIRDRKKLTPAEAVHPKLDWGNLRVHFEDLASCTEWHDRIWPENQTG